MDYLSADQTAEMLGVASRTVRRWWAGGQGPRFTTIPGRRGRVTTFEVVCAWLAGQQEDDLAVGDEAA